MIKLYNSDLKKSLTENSYLTMIHYIHERYESHNEHIHFTMKPLIHKTN